MVIIRPARAADLDHLVALLHTLFSIESDFVCDEAKQRRGLRLLLDSNRGCLLVAEGDDRVVGMVSGQLVISTAEGGLSLLVEDLVVDEQWRGQSVGRRLLEELGDWARLHNVSRLQLLADRQNRPALTFYQRLGWQGTDLICLRTHTALGQGE